VATEQLEGQPVQPVEGTTPHLTTRPRPADAALNRAARDLEASFLSVMLREAGLGAPRAAFGGGAGEEQFASFLTQLHAERMADSGGIGLAQTILRSLQERVGDAA
jgi:peptidoglycan hydrolase FlgJ